MFLGKNTSVYVVWVSLDDTENGSDVTNNQIIWIYHKKLEQNSTNGELYAYVKAQRTQFSNV